MKKNISNYRIAHCLCQGVKIQTKTKLRHIINCHCSQCMKTHGNFAAYTNCLEKDIIFLSKKTLTWYRSSRYAKRGFCSRCGGSIFYKKLSSKSISIAAGMFNYPTRLKTLYNIFTKGKLDYYTLDKKIPKFNQYNKYSV